MKTSGKMIMLLRRILLCLGLLVVSSSVIAVEEVRSKQIIVVVTSGWDAKSGKLFCFDYAKGQWEMAHDRIDVVVGKKGLGVGVGLHRPDTIAGPRKKEGDLKAPAGVFPLLFGFGVKELPLKKFHYRKTTPVDYWVDDPKSSSYNQWVCSNDAKLDQDWRSAETLHRKDGLYDYAIVVGHNLNPTIEGRGSAIFMHTWIRKSVSTSGCTAMTTENVKLILRWLDQSKHPILIQVPESLLEKVGTPEKIRELISISNRKAHLQK